MYSVGDRVETLFYWIGIKRYATVLQVAGIRYLIESDIGRIWVSASEIVMVSKSTNATTVGEPIDKPLFTYYDEVVLTEPVYAGKISGVIIDISYSEAERIFMYIVRDSHGLKYVVFEKDVARKD